MTDQPTSTVAGFNIREGDSRLVSVCCDGVLYTGQDLSAIPRSVLHIYEKFLSLCPPGVLRWYATENMTRHKACTPRALDMLRGWLRPGAPPRDVLSIELKDGARYDDASEHSFFVWGEEQGYPGYGVDANVVRCAFPARWAMEKPGELLAFAVDACEHFPFHSGHAGFALSLSPYHQEKSDRAAWGLSIQHPGLDISRSVVDSVALRREGIKGVNWLTMLGREFADRLGGIKALRQQLTDSVGVLPVTAGVILQAGPAPLWGHVNRGELLPDYRSVYNAVASLQEPIIERYGALDLPGGDHRDKTKMWLRRFANGG